jgi:Rrf2 family transcriptional regulator, nitric oxide-sensitive transcriptional repressor
MSMFSQTAEYALRVAAYLGSLDGQPATIRQIHTATHVPEGYLAKVLQSLSRAKLIKSQRGLHGGSVLSVPASKLSIFDVMQAVAPFHRITECPLNLKTHGTTLCPVHKRLDEALNMVEQVFRKSTIAELLAESSTSKPLCDAPPPEKPVRLSIRRRK